MKNKIKSYLQKEAVKDSYLRDKYDESKIDECIKYIHTEARKIISGECGFISDDTVYKWARHFFLDEINTDKVTTDKVTSENKAVVVEKQGQQLNLL